MRQREGLECMLFDESKQEMPYVMINTDTTFNHTTEDWAHASINCRNNRRVRGVVTGESMPIAYSLSRTETGAGVAHIFVDVRTFLLKFEGGFHFYWNVVVSDHHDGVISAVMAIEQG